VSGYYLMHRGWRDNPVFAPEPYTEREAWEWLIEHAAFADRQERVGRQMVDLRRGQVPVSVRKLADSWQWSKSRVQRYLAKLASASMVGTVEVLDGTILSLCKYETYQDPTLSRTASGGTLAGQRTGQRQGHGAGHRKAAQAHCDPCLFDDESASGGTLGGTPNGTISGTEIRTKEGKEHIGDPDLLFDQWWEEVPRKAGKGQARIAFRAALGKAPFDVLLSGIQRYRQDRDGQDSRFTKHPATWLNGECWSDEAAISEERPSASAATALADIEFDRAYQLAREQGPDAVRILLPLTVNGLYGCGWAGLRWLWRSVWRRPS
jgi:hypothetical protein